MAQLWLLTELEMIGRPLGERRSLRRVRQLVCGCHCLAVMAMGFVMGPAADLWHIQWGGGGAGEQPGTAAGSCSSSVMAACCRLEENGARSWAFVLCLLWLQDAHGRKGSLEQPLACTAWKLEYWCGDAQKHRKT